MTNLFNYKIIPLLDFFHELEYLAMYIVFGHGSHVHKMDDKKLNTSHLYYYCFIYI